MACDNDYDDDNAYDDGDDYDDSDDQSSQLLLLPHGHRICLILFYASSTSAIPQVDDAALSECSLLATWQKWSLW